MAPMMMTVVIESMMLVFESLMMVMMRMTDVVEDDGEDPAAPDRFASTVDGLGAKLVRGLVRQVEGTVTVEYAQGMRVQIRLPLPEDTS